MNKEIIYHLAKKKRIELECLGIDPKIYVVATKLLNQHCITRVINGACARFKNTEYYNKIKNPQFTKNNAVNVLEEFLGLEEKLIHRILLEWERDTIIHHNYMDNFNEFSDYILIPINYAKPNTPTEKIEDEKFNFEVH